MCIKIDFSSDDLPALSLTAGILMPMAIDFRNGRHNMGIPETIARRVVGALCFAGCIVAEVVENVVRVPLALILLLPSLCVGWDGGLPVITIFLAGVVLLAPILIVDLALRNLYAFVQNIYAHRISRVSIGEDFGTNCLGGL